ncbi:hypothetical protein [Streptomyces sp. SAJ15]|uniref:hypothetical protein n=1 Tax=Streptomyces sp. SAJ15 TaxID=2011095 RepID=UPI001186DD9E|nr:hypothetical protein [Streptomyces sp. SAJ15]TVL89203.1 hypothetical protein CD790_28925 [Streptomyces sp. SAJ15]
MATRRVQHRTHRRRNTATALAAAAVIALAGPALVGCDTVQKALDCAQLAVEISNDVDDLQDAVTGAAVNPEDADKILDTLNEDIDKISDKTDNADVEKAVEDLRKAVDNVRTAIDEGKAPDLKPVTDALGELTDVCSPG